MASPAAALPPSTRFRTGVVTIRRSYSNWAYSEAHQRCAARRGAADLALAKLGPARGIGEPERPASAAIEQFLFREVQVATMVDAESPGDEAEVVRTLGYFSLCGTQVVGHLAGSLPHRNATTLIVAVSHVDTVSSTWRPRQLLPDQLPSFEPQARAPGPSPRPEP
jgi:hypothetical protein